MCFHIYGDHQSKHIQFHSLRFLFARKHARRRISQPAPFFSLALNMDENKIKEDKNQRHHHYCIVCNDDAMLVLFLRFFSSFFLFYWSSIFFAVPSPFHESSHNFINSVCVCFLCSRRNEYFIVMHSIEPSIFMVYSWIYIAISSHLRHFFRRFVGFFSLLFELCLHCENE